MIWGKKECIGLIFGGESNEHEVSISSAKTVFQAFNSGINKQRFAVKAFYISKFGDWLDSDLSEKILVGEIENNTTKIQGILNQERINFLDGIKFQNVDVWFPLLHGFNGEDGSIHGLLKYTKKPLVGCGILGSALGMDKIMMKTIFSNLKLPQVNYLAFQNEDLNDIKVKNRIISEIVKNLNFPVFVKPSNSGSSLGISKVKNESEILQALEKAQKIDPRILVEEGLEVREIECGIIGNSKLITSEIGEVKYESDWYDYDSKYYSNNQITIPAEIDSKITKFNLLIDGSSLSSTDSTSIVICGVASKLSMLKCVLSNSTPSTDFINSPSLYVSLWIAFNPKCGPFSCLTCDSWGNSAWSGIVNSSTVLNNKPLHFGVSNF